MNMAVDGQGPSTSQDLFDATSRADRMILDVEQFKAAIAAPQGNLIANDQTPLQFLTMF